jgi:hypothetical protein
MRAISLVTRLPLLLAALATVAPAAHGQVRPVSTGGSSYVNEVREQLDYFSRQMVYRRTHDLYFDRLNHRREQNITLQLRAGVDYVIAGACDRDCSDLDFTLYDENGNYIDSDTGSDDFPIVEVTPQWTGPFTLKVHMYQCSVNPCHWGVGVYRR